MSLKLPPLPGYRPAVGPVILCILDGFGIGRRDDGDAVWTAETPHIDALAQRALACSLRAHGLAVGLPSDGDMGNSEVGHNALGGGRIFAQGARLVNDAIRSGGAFDGAVWPWLIQSGALHLLGLVSDGNVHSHIDHLFAILERAAADGVARVRVHVLTDGRDVPERSALEFVGPLEDKLAQLSADGRDYRIGSGGGRMWLTMDRYEADWDMVARGLACHARGEGRPFPSATAAIEALYAEDPEVNDQWLPAFVVAGDDGEPIGRINDGDGVLFFNFRGDRALEISRTFEGRAPVTGAPDVRYAGMMQYDGDLLIPRRYLVEPPAIDRTVGEHLAANGKRSFATSETHKYGHVTYFFNGNRSGYVDESLERYLEIASSDAPVETDPAMRALEITEQVCAAIDAGRFDHVRLNLANGDMVGHTGDFAATVAAVEVLDGCVGRLVAAAEAANATLIVTADHGNADQMYDVDRKTGAYKTRPDGTRAPRTAHSLNPVPFYLYDPADRWVLADVDAPGLANVGATVLMLCGLTPPGDYEPALVALKEVS